MEYFTNLRLSGPVLSNHPCDVLGVTEMIEEPELIGLARQDSSFTGDLALWRLEIHCVPIPGLWTIIDRRFVPALADGCDVPEDSIAVGAAAYCPG